MKMLPLPNLTGMPLAEIIVLCGFFMIYIVEEMVHKILSASKSVSEAILNRVCLY